MEWYLKSCKWSECKKSYYSMLFWERLEHFNKNIDVIIVKNPQLS